VANTAEALLFAADVARRSGHPRAAVPYLAGVVDRFGSDSRAAMAAFSLGRIHLYQLGSPAAAAKRFAQAWSLNPSGTLAEDALARETEAWSRAGRSDRAKAAALRYLKAYPKGHRLDAIKRFGGIE
jgi:transmembrane sensor